MVGTGATYMYYKIKMYGETTEANIYGGRLFARYLITNDIFAYIEYESLNTPNFNIYPNYPREWANSFFVGGGYLMRFSNKGGIMIMALYNLAWTPVHLIYSSPWNFRLGFMI